jgi:hypothetical protein
MYRTLHLKTYNIGLKALNPVSASVTADSKGANEMLFSINNKRVPRKKDHLLDAGVDRMSTQEHEAILKAMNRHVDGVDYVELKFVVGRDWPPVYGPIYAAVGCDFDLARKLAGLILLDVMHDRKKEVWYLYRKTGEIRNENETWEEVEFNVYFRKSFRKRKGKKKQKPLFVVD